MWRFGLRRRLRCRDTGSLDALRLRRWGLAYNEFGLILRARRLRLLQLLRLL